MLYSCIHMTTVGVKGLTALFGPFQLHYLEARAGWTDRRTECNAYHGPLERPHSNKVCVLNPYYNCNKT